MYVSEKELLNWEYYLADYMIRVCGKDFVEEFIDLIYNPLEKDQNIYKSKIKRLFGIKSFEKLNLKTREKILNAICCVVETLTEMEYDQYISWERLKNEENQYLPLDKERAFFDGYQILVQYYDLPNYMKLKHHMINEIKKTTKIL